MSTELERQKDNAYWERNQLVAALSKIFLSHLAKHPEEDKEWNELKKGISKLAKNWDMNRTLPKRTTQQ